MLRWPPLVLGPSRPRHERLHVLAQRSHLQLSLLGLLLDYGPLRVALAVGSDELEFQRTVLCLQGGHLGVGFAQSHAQAGAVLPDPVHPRVQLGQLHAFVTQHGHQLLRTNDKSGRHTDAIRNKQKARDALTVLTLNFSS